MPNSHTTKAQHPPKGQKREEEPRKKWADGTRSDAVHKLAQTNSSTKKRQRPDEEVGANSKGKSKTARQTGKGSGNPYAAHAQAQAHASSTTSTPASDETKRFGVVFFDDSDLSPNPKKQQQQQGLSAAGITKPKLKLKQCKVCKAPIDLTAPAGVLQALFGSPHMKKHFLEEYFLPQGNNNNNNKANPLVHLPVVLRGSALRLSVLKAQLCGLDVQSLLESTYAFVCVFVSVSVSVSVSLPHSH